MLRKMGNICKHCFAFCYSEEGHRLPPDNSTEQSNYIPLSESSEVRIPDEDEVEAKESSSRQFAEDIYGLSSKLLASPPSMPPSLEDEKAYTLAKALKAKKPSPRECLLCMEYFTAERPEVRTLCACGVNKNPYHLECLLAWRSRSGNTSCPVCDKELFYEEAMVIHENISGEGQESSSFNDSESLSEV